MQRSSIFYLMRRMFFKHFLIFFLNSQILEFQDLFQKHFMGSIHKKKSDTLKYVFAMIFHRKVKSLFAMQTILLPLMFSRKKMVELSLVDWFRMIL